MGSWRNHNCYSGLRTNNFYYQQIGTPHHATFDDERTLFATFCRRKPAALRIDCFISSGGSFCWSQNAVLVNSAKVEAIGWTGSGDGIIASGVEVVLWKRSGRSWEIAWKFKADQPQSLVSATWSC